MTDAGGGTHRLLAGRLVVGRPVEEAFWLFTPRGEQAWVPDWQPRFPDHDDIAFDDSAPGTVFETEAHGRLTTWVVVDRELGRRMRYARVVPHLDAGTVTVTLEPTDDGGGGAGRDSSVVTVTYELTALTDEGKQLLEEFAAHYPAFLQSWEEQITRSL